MYVFWNSLLSETVTAPTINSFKIDLTNIDCNMKLSIIVNLNFQKPGVEVTYIGAS